MPKDHQDPKVTKGMKGRRESQVALDFLDLEVCQEREVTQECLVLRVMMGS